MGPGTPRLSLPEPEKVVAPTRAGATHQRRGYVSEPSHQPSQEHPHAFAIGIHDVLTGPPHEGELGEGVLLRTDGATSRAILHQAPEDSTG